MGNLKCKKSEKSFEFVYKETANPHQDISTEELNLANCQSLSNEWLKDGTQHRRPKYLKGPMLCSVFKQ